MVKSDPNSWESRFTKYRREYHEGRERRRKLMAVKLGEVGDRELNYIVFMAKPGLQDAKEEIMDCGTYLEYIYASICEAEAHYKKVRGDAEKLGLKVEATKEERRKERERRE